MWSNIPQLTLGDIREYHPSDITQFSKLPSVTISLLKKFISRWESVLWLLQKKGDIFLFIKFVSENTQKHTSHASFSQLFVHNFSRSLENIWRIINTVASILEQIMSADKHPYTQRPLWEPPISAPYLTPFLAKGPPKIKEGDPLSPLRPISSIKRVSF